MRISRSLGQLELLVGKCVEDCFPFMLFFTFWNILFATFYLIQAADVNSDDYKGLNTFTKLFLQTYEDSVGNADVPIYSFWIDSAGEAPTTIRGFMVGLIWVTWFTNQWFIFIVLLNFIIAIIGQSYDSVMEKATQYMYLQRTDMNMECRVTLKYLGMLKTMDQFVLTASLEDGHQHDDDEFCGFVRTIEDYIMKQNKATYEGIKTGFTSQLSDSLAEF